MIRKWSCNQLCLDLLLQLNDFRKYVTHNKITKEMMLKAVEMFEVEYFGKNSYIVKQGEPAKKFYVLLSGKVSLRKRKKKQREEKFISDNVKHLSAVGSRISFNSMARRVSESYG